MVVVPDSRAPGGLSSLGVYRDSARAKSWTLTGDKPIFGINPDGFSVPPPSEIRVTVGWGDDAGARPPSSPPVD